MTIVWNSSIIIAARDHAEERIASAYDIEDVQWWMVLRDRCESMLAGDLRDDAIWPLLAEYADDAGCARMLGSQQMGDAP